MRANSRMQNAVRLRVVRGRYGGDSARLPANPFASAVSVEADALQSLVQRFQALSQAAFISRGWQRTVQVPWPTTFLKSVENADQILGDVQANPSDHFAIEPKLPDGLVPSPTNRQLVPTSKKEFKNAF